MKPLTRRRRCAFVFSALFGVAAQAQPTQRITITGNSQRLAPSVAGFGNTSLQSAPFAATVIDQRALQDAGISSLGATGPPLPSRFPAWPGTTPIAMA